MLLSSLFDRCFFFISELCPDEREPATPAAETTENTENTENNQTDVEPTAAK